MEEANVVWWCACHMPGLVSGAWYLLLEPNVLVIDRVQGCSCLIFNNGSSGLERFLSEPGFESAGVTIHFLGLLCPVVVERLSGAFPLSSFLCQMDHGRVDWTFS